AARRASEPHLGWTDQHLCKIQEEGYAENHDDDSDQTTRRAGEGNIAKARRGQCCNREVESICVVVDGRVRAARRFVDHARHDEYEDRQICDSDEEFFIAAKEGAVLPEELYNTE